MRAGRGGELDRAILRGRVEGRLHHCVGPIGAAGRLRQPVAGAEEAEDGRVGHVQAVGHLAVGEELRDAARGSL
jgi:hypothetical protein